MSALESYVEKLATAKAAEKEAESLVREIIVAAHTLGGPAPDKWKNLIVPGMDRAAMSNVARASKETLKDWPSMPDVAGKIRAYHQAILDCEAAYKVLTPEQKAVLPAPTRQP
jgi:hypothetical protein